MAMGKLSSLGIGSSVLSYDVIEKLRKADEKSLIAPVDKKIEQNIEKQKELVEIKGSMAEVNQRVKTLSDYSTFIQRKVDVTGDALKATADPGVPTQNISLDVKNIARNDINEIGTKFASRDAVFANEDGVLDFYSNGKNYRVKMQKGMSLNAMAQAVTDATDGNVLGVVMKTGGQKPYQLMINSKDTGEDNKVYFGSIIKSERLGDKPIKLDGEEDFYIDLHDKYENLQRISISVDLEDTVSLQEKAEIIRAEIKKQIEDNPDLKSVLDSGDITIGLNDEGRALIFNDRRGFKINVGGAKTGELGFAKYNEDSKSTDLYESSINAKAGKLTGIIQIGTVPIDLAVLTKEKNTSVENAEAIVNAIENIHGIHAKRVQGRVILNSEIGELKVSAVDDAGQKALKELGLKSGQIFDYTHLQKNLFRFKNVQSASDAELTFNGAMVKRSSNQIDDIINGLHVTLMHTTEEGKPVSINITNNTEEIIKEVKEFVKAYNELVPKLDASTKYNPETKRGGIFNTESEIRNIRPRLNQAFLYNIGNGFEVKSLISYGLTLNDKSIMSLDEAKLSSMVNSNPDDARKLFYGEEKKDAYGKFNKVDGVFVKLKEVLADLLEGGNAKLTTFEQKLEKEVQDYDKDKEKSKKILDTRYDTMANRFAAYDEQISKANNSFNAVQMMIDQAAGNNKKK